MLNQSNAKVFLRIKFISINIYALVINSEESMILNISYKGNKNLLNKNLENIKITICSNGEMSINNTKFIEVEPYKKKPVPIKEEKDHRNK